MAANALLIFGLVLTGLGVLVLLIMILRPPKPEPTAQDLDPGQIVEEIRKILESVEQRFRAPLIIVFVGLALAILGVYLKAKDAADQAMGLLRSTLS